MYGYLGGFRPEMARCSPGTVLIDHVLEAAIGEKLREFDFLRGKEAYKYLWGSRDRINHPADRMACPSAGGGLRRFPLTFRNFRVYVYPCDGVSGEGSASAIRLFASSKCFLAVSVFPCAASAIARSI